VSDEPDPEGAERDAAATREELNRRLVELCRRVAAENSIEARAALWRDRTPGEHGAALYALLEMVGQIAKARGYGWQKPPLPPTRIPRP
jgi:hypothetical protein